MQTATNMPPTIASAAMPTTKSVITIYEPRRWSAGRRAFSRGAQHRSATLAIGLPKQFGQSRPTARLAETPREPDRGACAGLSERACHGNVSSPVTWKNTVRHAGERPHHSAMGNILKIVGGCPISGKRTLNSRDNHSMSAMWAGEEEGRQA
jgi:hypothetical protein